MSQKPVNQRKTRYYRAFARNNEENNHYAGISGYLTNAATTSDSEMRTGEFYD